jgi:peptidoglycan hydrolase CwlO-like protein
MIFKQIKNYILISLLVSIVFFSVSKVQGENLEQICDIDYIDSQYEKLSRTEYQNLLEKCQAFYEEQSSQIEENIQETEREEITYSNQISILSSRIQRLQNEIYQDNLRVEDLSIQVEDTTSSIEKTSKEINKVENSLSQILRVIYEEDQKSLFEIFLSEDKISDFFNNIVSLELLGSKNKELLEKVKNLKAYLKDQKESLSGEKIDLEKAIKVQQYQKEQSDQLKQEQQYLLSLTQAEKEQYLREKEQVEEKAAEIRARIFSLIGISEAPTFGEAINVANLVTRDVSIRPAFLLAIISQESAMGRNVGQCYVTNPETGGGTYKSGQPVERIMHSTRDLPIFLDITGDSYSKTPVSCWIPQCATRWNGRLYFSGASVNSNGDIICHKSGYVPFGFGGAMGPAQFIPSTWKMYEDRVTSYTGKSTANPWDIRDSFTASASYLYDLGAYSESYWDEYRAASKYYGGSNTYASQVMTRASCIQDFMSDGAMSYSCQELIF